MDVNLKHTPFREALMRAWVAGWYAGLDEIRNDDGKYVASATIAEGFPAEDAAPDLLAAASQISAMFARCTETRYVVVTGELKAMLDAAIAKARKETT